MNSQDTISIMAAMLAARNPNAPLGEMVDEARYLYNLVGPWTDFGSTIPKCQCCMPQDDGTAATDDAA